MKQVFKLIVIAFVVFYSMEAEAQSLNGLKIESYSDPIVVYLNNQKVSSSTYVCFIANLAKESYNLKVCVVAPDGRQVVAKEGVVNYTGRGVHSIYIDKQYAEKPEKNATKAQSAKVEDPSLVNVKGMYKVPISDQEFKLLYTMVKRETEVSEKLNLIREATRTNTLTTSQVESIVLTEMTDEGRLSLLGKMYKTTSDRQNYDKLASVLTFLSSKEQFGDMMAVIKPHK